MSVQLAQDDQFTFVAGLNTEAGYFTFPKNTWKDGDNVIPDVSGSISRRVALDLEASIEYTALAITSNQRDNWAFTVHKWLAVGGRGDLNLLVGQAGPHLMFYLDTPVATSAFKKTFTVDLTTYQAAGNTSTMGSAPIKCTNANGKLLVTSRDTDPVLITYDAVLDTISIETITIKVRDFVGLDDGLAIDEKPATLSTEHEYNLNNQGWSTTTITAYQGATALYPSNAQSWIYGKDATDNFDSTILDKQDFGTSPAPSGRFVLNAFYLDRSTASGVAGITIESEEYRPSVTAFFAGRAWYAGIDSTTLGSTVYFSQVALDSSKYGKCYQDADPTSEVISDLVDSDGGAIIIQDCGEIIDLVTNDNGVLVFASNGIWNIIGTSQNGFTATGYEVQKLSGFGCVSQSAIVEVDDSIFYWSYSHICKVGKDQAGIPVVESVTRANIKTKYLTVPSVAKKYTSGAYNSSDGTIYWLFNNSLTTNDAEFAHHKTNCIALDTRIGAFYTHSFPTSHALPGAVDIITTKEVLEQSTDYSVVDASDNVVVAGADNVVAGISNAYASDKQYKCWTIVPSGATFEMTFSDFLNERVAPTKFYDWYTFDSVGVPNTAFLLTGYSFAPNGPDKRKQALYITTYMERTETGFDVDYNPINESSCTLQARWDFTDSVNANKWTAGEEVYRHNRMFIPSTTEFDDGYPVVISKSKIRGRGRALQLKYTADVDKDMVILGWGIPMYGGTNV